MGVVPLITVAGFSDEFRFPLVFCSCFFVTQLRFLAVGRGQSEGFDRLGTPTLLSPVRRL